MTYSVAAFLNNAMAMAIGVCAAVLAFRLLVFRYPLWQSRRLLTSTRQDLVRLTYRDLAVAETWFGGRMADRLLQYARLVKELSGTQRSYIGADMHGLDIGDELIHLRKSLARTKIALGGADKLFLRRVAEVFSAPPTAARAGALESATHTFLQALDRYPESSDMRMARGAVLQLQYSWQRWCVSQENTLGLT